MGATVLKMADENTEWSDKQRRAADRVPLDIEQMIINEPDAKQRAFLIVLNSINQALVANTSTVRDISDKLETHLNNFASHAADDAELRNKGKGAWRVMAYVLGIGQLVGIGVWTQVHIQFSNIDAILQTARAEHVGYEARLKYLEAKK